MNYIKNRIPAIKKVEYFTDGCKQQYKNCKSFLNLCHHKADFGIEASSSFFATSHGKTACDGIGGTVKRMVTNASLQRFDGDHITDALRMYEFCRQKRENKETEIEFFFRTKEEIQIVRNKLATRLSLAKTITGTMKYHNFTTDSKTMIFCKVVSADSTIDLKHNYKK
ncbi:MAG TPA: hypothetical protein DD806_06780 [Flavobacterium sp.]|nr:hypothetical protein [Flavobacterium sp.]